MTDFNNMTLEELAAMDGGDEEGFSFSDNTKKLKVGFTHPVRIAAQEVKASENSGYYYAKLTLTAIKADGSDGVSDTVVQCLPVFSDSVKASQNPEKLEELKKNWTIQMQRILKIAHPEQFSVFAESTKQNGKWKFFDKDGRQLSNAEKAAREKVVSKAVINVAKAMVEGKYSLAGTRCYFVWAPNKKDAANPYANFWSIVPDNYPLAD
jgi:hypothetical protein